MGRGEEWAQKQSVGRIKRKMSLKKIAIIIIIIIIIK